MLSLFCCIHKVMLYETVYNIFEHDVDGLMQKRCNSIANAMELHLFCTNPSMLWHQYGINITSSLWRIHLPLIESSHEGPVIWTNEQAVEQIVDMPKISGAMIVMWHNCNDDLFFHISGEFYLKLTNASLLHHCFCALSIRKTIVVDKIL